ncbi:Glucose-methanol-choline oxidoreductase [Penicillium cf. viridicatum]|uniref:Glucose-methanol-choline oxidoreductase n=1 Tax=Penicillium cf. viridicatum TaxID=2972119 RepID=A0A9W9JEC9_9EURO|nr:Glucose-methanol-choline oxidoreductase [Penicillium cf. viridicatum]
MEDHPIFGAAHRVNVLTASASANNTTVAALGAKQYTQNAAGALSIFGPGYYGWEKLPDLFRSNLTRASRLALSITADPKDGHQYATLSGALVSPLSRGSVRLAGPSMKTPPLIDPQWFRDIWAELAKLGVDQEEYFPGFNITTNAQILEFIHQSMTTVYHASATCKMGRKNDTMAGIDNHANVYGVQGLKVVDASSFPFLPPGHPQSIVYAFTEKIADVILGFVE